MDNYYGSNQELEGHYHPNTYIPEDLSHFQSNVYGHYQHAGDVIHFDNINGTFLTFYHLYYDSNYNELETGNKIILPQSVLNTISQYDGIAYPLIFKVEGLEDFLGVAEFDSNISEAYLPRRLFTKVLEHNEIDDMDTPLHLGLELYNKPIARGTAATFRVHDAKFIEIEDYKSYLEYQLQKNYSILQEGITIEIAPHPLLNYQAGENLKIDIVKTLPEKAIMITDTDLAIEFEEPLNYQEYQQQKQQEQQEQQEQQKEQKGYESTGASPFEYWEKREKEHLAKYKCLPVPYEIRNGHLRVYLKFR
jgi:hypothetical protein